MPDTLPEGWSRQAPADLPEGWSRTKPAGDQLYAEEREPPSTAPIDIVGAGRAVKGAAKTLTGLGVGAGQIAADIDPTGALARIGATRPAQTVKDWAMSPASSIAEEEGRVLPYFMGGGGSGIAGLARRATTGGMVAGFSPTESGSLESHEENAKWGVGMASALGAMGVPAAAIRSSPGLRHVIAHAINAAIGDALSNAIGHGHWGLLYALHHRGPGYAIAKRLPEMLRAAGSVPAGVTGKVATEHGDAEQ